MYFMRRSTGLANTFVYRKLGKMISHRLPNPLEAQGASIPVTIFHAYTREEYRYPEHRTPYLLVSNFGSCGDYLLNGESVQASDQLFYFANAGDELEICFHGRGRRETLLMMFDHRMVREAAAAWLQSPEKVLADAGGDTVHSLSVPGVPFSFTAEFRHLLDGVRRHVGGTFAHVGGTFSHVGGTFVEDLSERVLTGFLKIWSEASGIIRRVPAARAASRQELYRRLMVAKAFMEANVEAELTVERIAREALLNRFYFLELFRQAFQVTPHQYLRNLKLERAHALLRSGHSVTEVCQLVGYSSVGSFSNSFKDRFGCAPSRLNT
jgi:AraC-like DNA-binding protein